MGRCEVFSLQTVRGSPTELSLSSQVHSRNANVPSVVSPPFTALLFQSLTVLLGIISRKDYLHPILVSGSAFGRTCPPRPSNLVRHMYYYWDCRFTWVNLTEKIRSTFLRKDTCIVWLALSVPLSRNFTWNKDTCRVKAGQSTCAEFKCSSGTWGWNVSSVLQASSSTRCVRAGREVYRRNKRDRCRVPCKGLVLATGCLCLQWEAHTDSAGHFAPGHRIIPAAPLVVGCCYIWGKLNKSGSSCLQKSSIKKKGGNCVWQALLYQCLWNTDLSKLGS